MAQWASRLYNAHDHTVPDTGNGVRGDAGADHVRTRLARQPDVSNWLDPHCPHKEWKVAGETQHT